MSNQEDLPHNENMQNIDEQQLESVTGGVKSADFFVKLKQPKPTPTLNLGLPNKFERASKKPGLPTIPEGQEVNQPASNKDPKNPGHLSPAQHELFQWKSR